MRQPAEILQVSGAAAEPDEVSELQLRDIEMRFGTRAVLRGIDLCLAPGECLGLAGANGAGKTTLLRIAAGLLRPARGSGRLDGIDVQAARRRGWIGWAASGEASFTRRLTLRMNLTTHGRLAGLPRGHLRARIEVLADAFGFSEHLDVPAERCSSGLRQRAALARAVLHEPRLLLLDEPTRGIDAPSAEKLAIALRDSAPHGVILWVSHQAEELARADRAFRLEGGALVPHVTAPPL